MTVLIKKSVCADCAWRNSCQSLKTVNGISDTRNNPNHPNDIFNAIIVQCSMKNFDRSYKGGDGKLYYCTKCEQMHHSNSRIGIAHKDII